MEISNTQDDTQKPTVKLLFLGASKRVSLLERFYEAASRLGVLVDLYSCEARDDFYPISGIAKVFPAPAFMSPEFQVWLDVTIARHSIDIVIPNMDAATVALSEYKSHHPGSRCWAVVSSIQVCIQMYDKILSDLFFREHSILCPPNTPSVFPKILKPRFGFGAKGICKVTSEVEMVKILSDSQSEYLIQDFLQDSVETTVDIFISKQGSLIGYVLRDRLEVSDGEVMSCQTRLPNIKEEKLIESVISAASWQGCITLQYLSFEDNIYVVEINPRFGGGSTCAIESGLDMPYYILSESLGKNVVPPSKIKMLKMTRARRDFFHETA